MSDSEPSEKYRQLGLFGVIVAQVVIAPAALGGLVYFLMEGKSGQYLFTAIAAVLGLGVAFYRISLIQKQSGKK